MQELRVLSELGIMVAAAALGVLAARPLKIPSILAYLSAGVLLGPVAGVLTPSEPIELFAEVGVALLLFLVGLELSVEKIRALGTTALVTGLAQVAITFAAGYGVAVFLGFSGTAAVVMGLVTAFSSTVVVIKLLDRAGGLDSIPGRLAIGVLLVQDVLVAVALTFFSAVGGGTGSAGSPWAALAMAFGVVAVLGVVGAGVSRWILPPFLDWLEESGEGLFLFALAWAFTFILVAETFHLSVELGAFLAGVLLAQLRQSEELWRRTRPLVDFFLAVFFISLGSHMDLGAMGGNWGAAGAMAALVLVGKPLVIAVILGFQGQSPRVSVVTGITLGQVSEFAFILTALAIASGSVGAELAGFVGVLGMVTIGASALVVPHADAVAEWMAARGFLRYLPGRPGSETIPPPPRSGHVVVVGMNTLGRRIVHGFSQLGESVLAVDTDLSKLSGLPCETLVGDLTLPDVSDEAGLNRARLMISALQIEEVNDLLAYQCRVAGVPTSIHAFDPSLADELLEIGADHLLIPKQEGVGLMEARLRELGALD